MKDHLEDFIRNNRGAFDDKEPSENAWPEIESSLQLKKQSPWNSIALWRAAAVIFMALSVYLLIAKVQPSGKNDLALKEFSDVEKFYIRQISEKVELIDEYERREELSDFTNDFKQLEAMYQVLKEEMKNHPTPKVKDALVLNLLVRIDLLNQQLHKLEKDENPDAGKPKATI
jgi:hypothetical protein